MSAEKIQRLCEIENIPVTPVGILQEKGWQAGVYVYFVDATVNPNYKLKKGTVAMVDIWTSREGASGAKPNRPAGFLQHGSNRNYSNDFVEETYSWTEREPGNYFSLNKTNDRLVDYMGTGITSMLVASVGILKTYIFEKTDSHGHSLDYKAGDILYVSDNAIWTKEKFVVSGVVGYHSGYQVASVGRDEGGDFLILTNNY